MAIKGVVTPVPVDVIPADPPVVTAGVAPPVQAGDLTRNVCDAEGLHGREFFAGPQPSDTAMARSYVPRSHDIGCVQGRWSVAAKRLPDRNSDHGAPAASILKRTIDFIRLH